ncbi:hypothetical protein EAH79_14235 [Sphingomonas koreensis]|nr:hypothetical protein EAH79_14235 [Sphingomonas koreensis]
MSALFDNAVASIRMGIEDYQSQDAFRDISAVRNYYAGVLLLAKEALVQRFPDEDPDVILAAKVRPVADGERMMMAADGTATVDFANIGRRLKDFGVDIDVGRLEELRRIRNDIEHKYSTAKPKVIKRAIAKGFPVIAELFRALDKGPAVNLEEAWIAMLATTELYEGELARARATLASVRWHSRVVARAKFECPECSSELVIQDDPANTSQDDAKLACEACGTMILDTPSFYETLVDSELGAECYIRTKETGEEGPVYDCPSCDHATFIEDEWLCANCGYGLPDVTGRCEVCGTNIPVSDLLADPDRLLCSYHEYLANKDD